MARRRKTLLTSSCEQPRLSPSCCQGSPAPRPPPPPLWSRDITAFCSALGWATLAALGGGNCCCFCCCCCSLFFGTCPLDFECLTVVEVPVPPPAFIWTLLALEGVLGRPLDPSSWVRTIWEKKAWNMSLMPSPVSADVSKSWKLLSSAHSLASTSSTWRGERSHLLAHTVSTVLEKSRPALERKKYSISDIVHLLVPRNKEILLPAAASTISGGGGGRRGGERTQTFIT